MTNLWEGMQINQKKYVVETKDKVLERCIQLCSDVGDLVMDITTGSGVTAYTAEKLGRRWITCDASRVSLATTRWRLQTCAYPWYKLVDDHEGVDSGFEYESFLRLSAKTLSDIAKLEPTVRYNKPKIVQGRSRVTGPFTMESIPSPTVSSKATKITIRSEWIPMLENSGIMTKTGRLRFDRVERNEDVMSPIHAFGVIDNKKTAISFGPEYGPMGRYQVESVLADLSGDVDALFMAMAFDPVAKSIISKTKTAQAVQINNDVLIQDLKSQSSDQPFSMVGEPDIKIDRDGDRYVVRLLGYDYYSTDEDRMIVGDADDVAIWMLDTDYDGRTLRVKQLFFPNRPDLWDNLKRTLRSEVDSKLLEKYSGTESIAFEKGNHKRVAVKIIDKNGNESLKVVGLEEW